MSVSVVSPRSKRERTPHKRQRTQFAPLAGENLPVVTSRGRRASVRRPTIVMALLENSRYTQTSKRSKSLHIEYQIQLIKVLNHEEELLKPNLVVLRHPLPKRNTKNTKKQKTISADY